MKKRTEEPLVICFGDSLTVGLTDGSPGSDVPYGRFLQEWLGSRGRVVIRGLCGELTSTMVERFTRDVVNHKPDTVVILGGTNDLGHGVEPFAIAENLSRMYSQADKAGIQAVGVTVPSIRPDQPLPSSGFSNSSESSLPEWIRPHISIRLLLNRRIEELCSERAIPCIDLFSETIEEPHRILAAGFSSDGLHLTPKGYERFAKIVWEQVFASQFGENG